MDYFPYTHGDLLETQRKTLLSLQQQELMKTMQAKEQKKLEEKRALRQSFLN